MDNLVREVQASLASYSPDKLGALCLLAPLASSLFLQSLPALLWSPPFSYGMKPSSLTFLLLTLALLLFLTLTRHPGATHNALPPALLNFPFRPVEVARFTPYDSPSIELSVRSQTSAAPTNTKSPSPPKSSTPAHTQLSTPTTKLPRSASHQDLGKPFTLSPRTPLTKTPSLSRSSSHNTYLALRSTSSPPMMPTLEDLTDEEANKQFSAFIESRLATMKLELLDKMDR